MAVESKVRYSATDNTKRATKSVSKGIASVSKTALMATGALATLAGVGGLGALIRSSAESADNLTKLAKTLGLSEAALAGYKLQADLAGISQQSLESSFDRFSKRLGEATKGEGAAAKELERLGLNAQALIDLGLDDAFQTVSEQVARLSNEQAQSASAAALFGREGTNLVRIMREGRNGIAEARAEVEQYGGVLSRLEFQEIEAGEDALVRMRFAAEGLGTQLAAKLAPTLISTADSFIDITGKAVKFIEALRFGAEQIGIFQRATEGISEDETLARITAVKDEISELTDRLRDAEKANEAAFRPRKRGSAFGVLGVSAEEITAQARSLSNNEKIITDALTEREEILGKLEKRLQSLNAKETERKRILAEFERGATEAEDEQVRKQVQRQLKTAVDEVEKQRDRLLKDSNLLSSLFEADDETFDRIRVSLLTAEEFERESFERRIETIRSLAQRRAISEAEANQQIERENARHQKVLKENAEKAGKQKLAFTKGLLSSLLQIGNTQNRALFRVNQAAAVANAIVNTHQGVTAALGEYPPPLSFVMAAAVAAKGASEIAAIKGTSFGGGGGVSAGGSGGAALAAGAASTGGAQDVGALAEAEQRQQPATIQVAINGAIVSNDPSTGLLIAEQIATAVSEFDVVLISPESRQGQELISAANDAGST